MPPWLASVPLAEPAELVVVAVLAGAAVVMASLAPTRSRLLASLLGALGGAAVGLGLAWVLTQPLDLFDVSLSPTSYAWAGAAFAGVGAAIPALTRGRSGVASRS